MKICYVYRPAAKGGKSIEEIFRSIAAYIEETTEHQVVNLVLDETKGFVYNLLKIRSVEADVFHITGDVNYFVPFLYGKKTILTVHDIGYYHSLKGLKKKLYKFLWFSIPLRFSDCITTVSKYTLNEILRLYPTVEFKSTVIHNPVSKIFKFNSKQFNSHSPVFLQVGTGENKNLATVIEAIKNYSGSLIVIGRLNAVQNNLLNLSNIDYENHVNISHKEVSELYNRADIVLFISTHEGFGMPIVEAQSVGRAVISSAVTSIPEVALNTVPLVTDPLDPHEVRQCIDDLLSNPDRIDGLVEAGLENVKRFELSNISDEYISVYSKLLKDQV